MWRIDVKILCSLQRVICKAKSLKHKVIFIAWGRDVSPNAANSARGIAQDGRTT